MASKVELEFWARLDALEKERDRLLNLVAPKEHAKEAACKARNKANAEAEALAAEINDLTRTLPEIMGELRLVRVALNGKTRPPAEEMIGQ
jgi:chromosome segregation ATPase